jgi:hypothetical protein
MPLPKAQPARLSRPEIEAPLEETADAGPVLGFAPAKQRGSDPSKIEKTSDNEND